MTSILVNILFVLAGCGLMIGGSTFAVWVIVHLLAPMTGEDLRWYKPQIEEPEKPPPPRSAVRD